MCGICGIVGDKQDAIPAMMETLRHRGPDDEGQVTVPSGAASLGFRRLSIIDLQDGNQPMTSEDGKILLVFNGEIYNFRELRENLEKIGHKFRSRCDAEVVVHLYEEKGVDCLQELSGMFAFAIWDDRDQSLFLARDRIGKKPLSYWHDGDRLVFGSEIKAVLQHPDVPREFNPDALPYYLNYLYVPAPHTMFRGIQKLPPGHWLRFQKGKAEIKRYWDPDPGITDPGDVRETLRSAVKRRLIADVPLGAFLSGGIDSSIIVGLMSELSDAPVKTYSIGFEEESHSELEFARAVAKKFGTEHHEFTVRPDAVDVLPKLVRQFDEPFADSSMVPTWYVSRETAKHVKVALSGDGGDECFGGYKRYGMIARLEQVRRFPRVAALAWSLLFGKERRRRLADAVDRSMTEHYLDMVRFSPGLSADPGEPIRRAFERFDVDAVTAASYADMMTYLPGDILTKVDIASMECSLEVRCPFLDHDVLEMALRLPPSFKVRGKRLKAGLKDTFRDLLPESVQSRGKMGFSMPVGDWLRGPLKSLVEDSVLSKEARERGVMDFGRIEKIARAHLDGKEDHTNLLWSLLCLEMWFRTCL